MVIGFEMKKIFVLESTQINNATYVLKRDWEYISKLSKAEVLNNKLHFARVIHNNKWYESITNLLS